METSDPRIGQHFGGYVVEGMVGRGGMGVVFRARSEATGEVVALKLMAPDLADNPTFRDRFIREAEASPNLAHPNIVPVLGSGGAGGQLFIAMQLIDGIDLKRLIQVERRLDPKRVLAIFRQIASALDAAHEAGMVHRDVKPQNILIVPRESPESIDRVYITDFGLVRPVTSEATASRTGQVFGSVAYMAPELIEDIPADGRADVYALGCVLYECLTGKVPFERSNEVSTVWAHIHEDPPLLTDTCHDLPGGLNDVLIKAMSKHPDDRFLTCGEFVTELELGLGRKFSALKYSHVRPLVARVPRRKTEREVWAPNFFPELSRVRAASRERFDWRKGVALVAAVALLSTIQIGRDGGIPQAVADVADAANSVVDAVVAPDPEPTEIVSGTVGTVPQSAADGRAGIAPSDRRKLKAFLPTEDPSAASEGNDASNDPSNEAVAPTEAPQRIAWARGDVGSLTGATPTDIWVMDADGSNKTKLTDTPAAGEFYPSWSPDGRYIAYVRQAPEDPNNYYTHEIWVMNSDGSKQQDMGLCPGDANCGKLAWSPDGRRVAYVQGTGLYIADLTTGTRHLLAGEVKPASAPGQEGGPGPTWSPNGKWLAFTCNDDLCVIPARGGKARVIGPELTDVEWSPAGPWLVGEFKPGEQQAANLFVVRADGTDRRQLTQAIGTQGARKPSWAPDGRAVVYTDWSTGTGLLYRITIEGSGRVQLTSGPDDYTPDWWGPPT